MSPCVHGPIFETPLTLPADFFRHSDTNTDHGQQNFMLKCQVQGKDLEEN